MYNFDNKILINWIKKPFLASKTHKSGIEARLFFVSSLNCSKKIRIALVWKQRGIFKFDTTPVPKTKLPLLMAKNTKTGRKPPKDPETPVCSYEGGIPPGKIRELCVCWNINTKSYSFKIDTCVKGDPNVAWLRNGWLSLKTELVNNNPNHVYLIDELNQVLHDDIKQWPCWVNGIPPKLPAHGGEGVSFEGHLHFRDNAAALCFLSKFYHLHSCPVNPLVNQEEIENPCSDL